MKLSDAIHLNEIIFSACCGLFSAGFFFFKTAEIGKSFAAGVFVFFLTWLTCTVIRWIFKSF